MTKTNLQQEWETRIAEYRASGQGAKTWCAAHNVTTRQLWYWIKKCKSSKNDLSTRPAQWLPLEVSYHKFTTQEITLLVRVGEASIEVKPGFDPVLLSEVVRVLSALCSGRNWHRRNSFLVASSSQKGSGTSRNLSNRSRIN